MTKRYPDDMLQDKSALRFELDLQCFVEMLRRGEEGDGQALQLQAVQFARQRLQPAQAPTQQLKTRLTVRCTVLQVPTKRRRVSFAAKRLACGELQHCPTDLTADLCSTISKLHFSLHLGKA